MQTFDVVIAGGGMVGLAVACGLQGSRLRVAVLEQNVPDQGGGDTASAVRVSAINAASERLLEHLGVWPAIQAQHVAGYHSLEVWERDSFGHITFNEVPLGAQYLGYIIENKVINQALRQQAERQNNITLLAPARLQQVVFGDSEAFVTLDNGDMMSTRLLVAADGANSWLRNKADIPLTFWDYEHHALVATVRTEQAHGQVARQVFHGHGILAFLPLADPHLCSIVWSLPPQDAHRLQTVADTVFNQQLAMAFDMRLGCCHQVSERYVFPLMARYARQFAAHRLVLAGDAAHTIHPLAGQGVNLGFMDAACLTGELKRLHQQGKDIGEHLYLRRYERSRKYHAAKMLAGMQGFRTLFAGQNPVKKLVRDMGLMLTDNLPALKSQLLKEAMGLNDLPDWLG